MNEVGNYNLDKIDSDFEKRLKKAKLYFELINDNVAYKTNCFEGENSLLEYAIILKEKGYPIARRTVAKYREQLDLPVARLRKQL